MTETARSESSAPFTRLVHPERLVAVETLGRHDAEVAIILNVAGRVAGAMTGGLTGADGMRLAQAKERPLTVEILRSTQE